MYICIDFFRPAMSENAKPAIEAPDNCNKRSPSSVFFLFVPSASCTAAAFKKTPSSFTVDFFESSSLNHWAGERERERDCYMPRYGDTALQGN